MCLHSPALVGLWGTRWRPEPAESCPHRLPADQEDHQRGCSEGGEPGRRYRQPASLIHHNIAAVGDVDRWAVPLFNLLITPPPSPTDYLLEHPAGETLYESFQSGRQSHDLHRAVHGIWPLCVSRRAFEPMDQWRHYLLGLGGKVRLETGKACWDVTWESARN